MELSSAIAVPEKPLHTFEIVFEKSFASPPEVGSPSSSSSFHVVWADGIPGLTKRRGEVDRPMTLYPLLFLLHSYQQSELCKSLRIPHLLTALIQDFGQGC